MRIDGEVTTGILGADAEWDRLLAGVAVSLSEGEGAFEQPGVTGTIGEHLHVVAKIRREPIEEDATEREASAMVRARVERAREAQRQRWGALNQDVEAGRLREGAVLMEGDG